MTQIRLTTEQASVLEKAGGSVAICRPDGSVVGWFSSKSRFIVPHENPFTAEEIAEAVREADSTTERFTTREVLDHARSQQRP
jgi:hypothetical protein